MSKCSIVPGIVGMILSSSYAFLMSLCVIYCAEKTGKFEFGSLLSGFNKCTKRTASIIVMYVAGSSCLSYIMLIGDLITQGLHGISDKFEFEWDRGIYIAIVGVLVLIPLTLFKNLKSLQLSSLIGNFAVLYCVGLLIYYAFIADIPNTGNVIINQWDYNILIMTNVGAKGFASVFVVPPMYQQLRDRSIKRWIVVMTTSFAIVACIYLIFSISGYYLFGNDTNGDVLKYSYVNDIYFIIARLGMAFSITGTVPLVFKPFIKAIEFTFFDPETNKNCNFNNNGYIRVLIIIVADLVVITGAIFIEDVGLISSFEGGVTVLGLMCLFPCLMMWDIGITKNEYFSINKNRNKKKLYSILLLILFIFGFIMGLGGLIVQFYMLYS